MKTYKAITINGEPHLELPSELQKSPSYGFYETQQTIIPYIGPAIPDGTILDESEVELEWEYQENAGVNTGRWFKVADHIYEKRYKNSIYNTRRVATRKAKEPEASSSRAARKFERMLKAGDKDVTEGKVRTIGHYQYDLKAGTETFTPSNSEEGEQPMKEDWKRLYQNIITILSEDVSELLEKGDTIKLKWLLDTIVKNGNSLLTKK